MKTEITVFPRIIARVISYFAQKGGDYSRKAIISNIAYRKSCPKDVVFFIFKKIITLNKLNMGFLSVPNLVPWLFFRAWIVTDLAGSGTASTWQGGDKRKRRYGKRGKVGRLFQIFPSNGAIIRGNTVTCNSSLWKNENMFSKNKTKRPRKPAKKRLFFCESRTPVLRRVMVIKWLGALQFYVLLH